jgi:hypothetical protein
MTQNGSPRKRGAAQNVVAAKRLGPLSSLRDGTDISEDGTDKGDAE